MNFKNLTVAILTNNEERNIFNCLNNLKKFSSIYVFDSFSSDKTRQICKTFKNVKIILTKKNMNYVEKKNYALKTIKNGFILLIDADYIFSKNFYNEILKINLNVNYGYAFDIYNKTFKKVLFEKLYPSKLLLFYINRAYFKSDGHKEKLFLKGRVKKLKSYIIHDDKKSFKVWLLNQNKYARMESLKIVNSEFRILKIQDKIRKFIFFMNIVNFIYYLFVKKLFKYGLSGIIYIIQRQIYEINLSFRIFYLYFLK
jgi:hypothetical protein